MYMGWETVPYENVSGQLLGQLAVSGAFPEKTFQWASRVLNERRLIFLPPHHLFAFFILGLLLIS